MSLKMYEAYRILPEHDPYEVLWRIKSQARGIVKEKLTKFYLDIVEGRSAEAARRVVARDELFQKWLDENPSAEDEGWLGALNRWAKERDPLPEDLQEMPHVYAVSNKEIWDDLLAHTKLSERKDTVDLTTVNDWVWVMYGQQLTRYQRDHFALDVSLNVWVDNGVYLIAPYCDRASLVGGALDFLSEMPEITDYAYWDNVDPDEDVSDEEWQERGEVWNRLTDHDRWDDHLNVEIVCYKGWTYASPLLDIIQAR